MAFFAEYNAIPPTSTHFASVQAVNEVVDFLHNEMVGAGRTLEDLADMGEDWLNSDKNSVYFELETNASYSCNVRRPCQTRCRTALFGGAAAHGAVSAAPPMSCC